MDGEAHEKLRLIEIGKSDLFVNTSNQGLFAGRGYTDVVPLVGAILIPVGLASSEKHLKLIAELRQHHSMQYRHLH